MTGEKLRNNGRIFGMKNPPRNGEDKRVEKSYYWWSLAEASALEDCCS